MDVTTQIFLMCCGLACVVMVAIKVFVMADDDIEVKDEDCINKEDFSDELDWKIVKEIANKLSGESDEEQ